MTPERLDGLEQVIEEHRHAVNEVLRGRHEPFAAVYSRRDDVTLGNPFGPFALGYERVVERLRAAAALFRDGHVTGFERIAEYVADDLACTVEVEHSRTKVDGRDDLSDVPVRCTSVYRREDEKWRLVHRHAEPITSPRPAESVITD